MSNLRPVIVAVGSTLMADDGVGVEVLERLRLRGAEGRADLIDAGLAFGDVLCDLDPHRPLAVIDAVRAGGQPGSIYRLRLDELTEQSSPSSAAISLHELSVLPALKMAALAGVEFEDVTIFGVEPQRIEWGQPMSRSVGDAVDGIVEAVLDYLDQRGGQNALENSSAANAARSDNR